MLFKTFEINNLASFPSVFQIIKPAIITIIQADSISYTQGKKNQTRFLDKQNNKL